MLVYICVHATACTWETGQLVQDTNSLLPLCGLDSGVKAGQ